MTNDISQHNQQFQVLTYWGLNKVATILDAIFWCTLLNKNNT